MRQEYGALEATIEVVKGLDEAIDHIHKYGIYLFIYCN